MYPTSADDPRGIVVAREVEALRAAGWSVDVVSKPPGTTAYASQLRAMVRRLKASEYTAVHAHYGTAAILPRLYPGRFRRVVTLHGSDVTAGPRPRASRFWLQYLLSATGSLGVDAVFVQARFMAELLPERVRRHVTVLPQPIDLETFRPGAGTERREDVILFLGRRHVPLKRHGLAREVVEGLGDGLRLVALDEIPPAGIPRAMREARAALLTSEREGMPVSVKESLVSGLPVVAVDLPGTRELADAVPGIHIAAHDPASLRAALRRVLDEPPLEAAVVERIRAVFRERSWDAEGHRRLLERAYLG
jgi:glycosyltransferase involved in cell wall biosynthesis